MAEKKERRTNTYDYIDLVAWVSRASLSYGINGRFDDRIPIYPHSRQLILHGAVALPDDFRGFEFEATLFGDRRLSDEPREQPATGVASIERRNDRISIVADVPPDFIPTLSAAYHDGRLNLFYGRGSRLVRNKSLLTSIDFQDHAYFEESWGQPIPKTDSA